MVKHNSRSPWESILSPAARNCRPGESLGIVSFHLEKDAAAQTGKGTYSKSVAESRPESHNNALSLTLVRVTVDNCTSSHAVHFEEHSAVRDSI